MKIKHCLTALLIGLLMVMPMSLVHASGSIYVTDEAGLLSESEEDELVSTLESVSNAHGTRVCVLTVNSLDGYDDMGEYAADRFDSLGISDGILYIISMETNNHQWYLYRDGDTAKYAFTKKGMTAIGEKLQSYLSDSDWETAFSKYASLCDKYLTQAENGEPYGTTKKTFNGLMSALISMVSGLVLGFGRTASLKGELKSVKSQQSAANYVVQNSLNLTRRQDLFLFRNVTRTPRPKENRGGGSHHSGGGFNDFGGGGGGVGGHF